MTTRLAFILGFITCPALTAVVVLFLGSLPGRRRSGHDLPGGGTHWHGQDPRWVPTWIYTRWFGRVTMRRCKATEPNDEPLAPAPTLAERWRR